MTPRSNTQHAPQTHRMLDGGGILRIDAMSTLDYIYIEVEDNPNCGYMPMQVYEPQAESRPITRVRIEEPDYPHGVYEVTGWSSAGDGSAVEASYAPVSDSGQATAHLVYGGDWGIRLKPVGLDEDWDTDSSRQYGEPYLILLDAEAILSTAPDSPGA